MNLNDFRLQLDYPCLWTYTVIGSIHDDIRRAIADVIGDADHSLRFSHNSKTGRYLSLRLEMVVYNDAQRVGIYQSLSNQRAIKLVL